jgi:hypothetical protein
LVAVEVVAIIEAAAVELGGLYLAQLRLQKVQHTQLQLDQAVLQALGRVVLL